METDISRMGGDNPRFEPAPLEDYQDFQQQQQQPPQYQQHYDYMPSQMPHQQPKKASDFFADIDKKAWIFILVALIIGFFMGKTMQPIILKTG
jgi:hypothetical protein